MSNNDAPRVDAGEPQAGFAQSSPASTTAADPPSLFPAALYYAVAAILLLAIPFYLSATDYVGFDNDDTMRLVEIRDYLNGQGWFDLTQYRLGLEGGTLMHWSRLVDLPMALLIRFFSLFGPRETAEAIALAVWPLTLAALLVGFTALAGLRIGGRTVMHLSACFAMVYLFGMGRFSPGSADHHNVQLTLAALLVAMLLDPQRRPASFAIAGVAGALGIAIGAETAPFVAAACLTFGFFWAWHGALVSRAVSAFSLAFVTTITAAFFLTVPPSLYRMVTCDNLSLGFYALGSIGGLMLFLNCLLLGRSPRLLRFAGLAVTGLIVLLAAKIIAPECLGNPLATLDPMLRDLWLSKVVEARPVLEQIRLKPYGAGGFYAVGLIALLVCLVRIYRNEKREVHLLILPLLAISYAVTMVQVRGAMFANLLSILPMAMLVADLRAFSREKPQATGRSLLYLGSLLVSMPLVWSLAGLILSQGTKGLAAQVSPPASKSLDCSSKQALQPLADLPPGVVLAPSDLGVNILRYTPHRILSAPYHRNQGGMLTELNTGLALPEEAIAFLRGAKVNYVVFCRDELQTVDLVAMKPDGFYAALSEGRVPAYLKPVGTLDPDRLQIFTVQPE